VAHAEFSRGSDDTDKFKLNGLCDVAELCYIWRITLASNLWVSV